MNVRGVRVICETDYCDENDIETAVERAIDDYGVEAIEHVKLQYRDGYIGYRVRLKNFDRIRRITGYLVGDMKTWNDAKRAEEKDRVKHG